MERDVVVQIIPRKSRLLDSRRERTSIRFGFRGSLLVRSAFLLAPSFVQEDRGSALAVAQLESDRREEDEEGPEPDNDAEAAPDMVDRVAVLLADVRSAVDRVSVAA